MFLTVGDSRQKKEGRREGERGKEKEREEGENEMEVINMGAKLTHSAAAVLECAQRECSGIARGVCGCAVGGGEGS